MTPGEVRRRRGCKASGAAVVGDGVSTGRREVAGSGEGEAVARARGRGPSPASGSCTATGSPGGAGLEHGALRSQGGGGAQGEARAPGTMGSGQLRPRKRSGGVVAAGSGATGSGPSPI